MAPAVRCARSRLQNSGGRPPAAGITVTLTQSSAQGFDETEAERLRAVGRDSFPPRPDDDDGFDRIVGVAARTFSAPMATVSIIDRDRIRFKAVYGLEDMNLGGHERGRPARRVLVDDYPR
ncbi:hypothetical protein MDOR_20190 [Mycolicibacterium doricum]|uniref:Uncharacterized protein n=1 Tax=Mycolicibacterium doricum TaxID=126673 RepID=A0A7I7VS58_9MYCO|nr:hypothetical protein MDOR_20190 [Mycolicibacterium doricum]